jgi:hypothetical protein
MNNKFKVGDELKMKSSYSDGGYVEARKLKNIRVSHVKPCFICPGNKGCLVYKFEGTVSEWCDVEENFELKETYINLEL